MRRSIFISILLGVSIISGSWAQAKATSDSPIPDSGIKEWTFLIYLNGNNNLDQFGSMNINQMENVGSTADINIVTQWASLRRRKVDRLYIIQDQQSHKVTSPVVQGMGDVDMGDWHNLVDFIHWGVTNYPAKHYFIDVWNHGSGWHSLQARNQLISNFRPFDISWDDNTGNSISTLQLGDALADAAKFIGHKVDLYASDACLMGMVEIAHEVADSVDVFGGSEEVEAGAGWPYDAILSRWAAQPQSTPLQVGEILTDEYVKSYNGGQNGDQEATFAVYDLSKLPLLVTAIGNLGSDLSKLDLQTRARVMKVVRNSQNFAYSDYVDLKDFIGLLEKEDIQNLGKSNLGNLKGALKDLVVSNSATPSYSRAGGLSIWLPTSRTTFDSYVKKYAELKFQADTGWSDALRVLLKRTVE